MIRLLRIFGHYIIQNSSIFLNLLTLLSSIQVVLFGIGA